MEIEKETIESERIYTLCPKCKKKISGVSESQLISRLRMHNITHEVEE